MLKVPKGSERFRKVPKGSERFRKVPKGSERFRKVPKGSKRFQKVPKGFERFQKVQKSTISKVDFDAECSGAILSDYQRVILYSYMFVADLNE